MRTFGVVALLLLAACSEPEDDGGGCVGACDDFEYSDTLDDASTHDFGTRCTLSRVEASYFASCELVTITGQGGVSGEGTLTVTLRPPPRPEPEPDLVRIGQCRLQDTDEQSRDCTLDAQSTSSLTFVSANLRVRSTFEMRSVQNEYDLTEANFSDAGANVFSSIGQVHIFQAKFDYERVTSGDRVRSLEARCEVGTPQPLRLSRPNGWARLLASTPEVACNVVVYASIGGMTMPIERRVEGIGHGDIVYATVSAGQVLVDVRTESGESDGGPLPTDASVDG